MQNDMFNSILYNLYDIFFDKLTSENLKNLALASHETNNLMISLGGFAKSITFDWKTHLSLFFKKICTHKRITKMYFFGSGTQISILDILPPLSNIKVLVLNDSPDVNMCRSTVPVISSNLAKPSRKRILPTIKDGIEKTRQKNNIIKERSVRKVNVWKNLKYMFIRDNNSQQYNISLENFPNIKYIGAYKANILFVQESTQMDNPYTMEFRDNQSIELIINKSPSSIAKITSQLKKIYS